MADSVPFWLYRPSAARAHAMELLSQLRAASGHRHRGHIQRAAALGPPFGGAWRRLLPMLPQHLWRIWRFARLPRSLLAVAWRSNISIGGISDDLCDCERELTIRTMSPPLPPPTLPSVPSFRSFGCYASPPLVLPVGFMRLSRCANVERRTGGRRAAD